MRILRIIYDFADKNVQAEGLSPGPYEVTVSQGNFGEKIYVLTGNLNGKNLKARRFKYELCNGNVVVYNLPRAIWKFGPFLSSSIFVLLYYFYFRLTGKIDLVHNHQQMGVWFLVYKKLFGFIDRLPVVHTNHGGIKAREEKALAQGIKLPFMTKYFEYPIHKLSDALSVQVADSIIAVSEDLEAEMIRYYHPKKPIYIVENSVNTIKFKKDGERVDFGFKKGDVIMGNIGRLSKRKNIDVAIESLRFLPEKYKLVLIGTWDEEFKQTNVDPIIEKYKLADRINYLGPIAYWDIDAYYRSLDLFLLISTHEGLPKAAVEALSSGCKCIGSGFKMAKDIPDMHYLSEIDAKVLAGLIAKVAEKPDNYKETRKIIEEHYSWDSKAKMIHEIYEKVVKK